MTLIKHDGWSLILEDAERIKALCVEKFIRGSEAIQSVVLDAEIKAPHVHKTASQLGYLHAAVWPVFYQYYRDQGEPVETREQMEHVRDDVKWAIGFIEVQHNKFSIDTRKVRSFADASKEETSEAIDQLIRLAADFGMIVPSPREYLMKHQLNEFIS